MPTVAAPHQSSAESIAPISTDEAKISAEVNADGEVAVSFPEASGFYRAENYKITLSSNGEEVENKSVLSDYTRATDFEKTVILGKLEASQYTVKIRAFSPYAELSDTLEWGFEVAADGAVDTAAASVAEVKK